MAELMRSAKKMRTLGIPLTVFLTILLLPPAILGGDFGGWLLLPVFGFMPITKASALVETTSGRVLFVCWAALNVAAYAWLFWFGWKKASPVWSWLSVTLLITSFGAFVLRKELWDHF